jgi:hypothetical protein
MGLQNSHVLNNENKDYFFSVLQKYAEDNDPSQILPYLFVGTQYINNNPDILIPLGITHMMNVAGEKVCENTKLFERLPYLKYTKTISKDLRQEFNVLFAFIDHARYTGGKVVIHCENGRSRSTSVAIAYLMNRYGLTLNFAFNFVKSKRPCLRPRRCFVDLLESYEKELFDARNIPYINLKNKLSY